MRYASTIARLPGSWSPKMVTSVDTDSVWAPQLECGADVSRPADLDGTWGWGQALEGFWRDVFSVARPGARVLQIGGRGRRAGHRRR